MGGQSVEAVPIVQDVVVDDAQPAELPDIDWAVFGDDNLAAVLKQACQLKLVNEESLRTISGNLRSGQFSTEHYFNLYSDRVWRATHKEEVAAMEAQQAAEQMAQQQAVRQAQRDLAVTSFAPLSRPTGQTLMTGHIGGSRFVLFYWLVYISLLGNVVVTYILRNTEYVYLYPSVFIVTTIYCKFLAGNTFLYLDASPLAIAFTLTTDGLFVSAPPTGPCGCCPQPIPALYAVRQVVPAAAITEVNVYTQVLKGSVVDTGGAVNGGPTLSYHVDGNSIAKIESPSTRISGRPTLFDFVCQPCFLMGALAGCGEGGSFTQIFLGAMVDRTLVRLSKPVFSSWLIADAFAARDKLRAQLEHQVRDASNA